MDDSQARFAAMLAGFMSDVKAPETDSSEAAAPPPKSASPAYKPAAPVSSSTRDASESVAELTLNDDVDENPEDRVIDPNDDMYRASVSKNDRNESNADLPPALRKAMANAKPSFSSNESPAPTPVHAVPPPRPPAAAHPVADRSGTPPRGPSPPPPRSASPPPKPASAHPPLSSSSSTPSVDSSSASTSATSPPSSPGSGAPAGPVYKTIMVNGPNGEKREMKIIAINPGKPLLTSEGISSKPTGGGYGGSKGWVDDDEATKCMRCPNEFSVTNRRHHCRACGFVVCGTCSNHTEVLSGSDERHRVCFHCFFEIAKTGKRPYPIDRPSEAGGSGLGDMFAFSKKEH